MSVSGTLGSMLQGVSQQAAHIRNDGQVTEQINMASDVVRGLTSRPGSELVSTGVDLATGLTFRNVVLQGDRFQVGTKAGVLQVVGLDGLRRTVTFNAGTAAYIGAETEVYVYDDVAYLLNRDKIAAMSASTTAQLAQVVTNQGLVSFLGGAFDHTYQVIVEYEDGVKFSGTYTAPSGTTAGDAAKTTSDYICNQVTIALNAHPSKKAGTSVERIASVLRISGVTNPKITVLDGTGGTLIRSQTNTIANIEDLAELAAHGTLVRVVGAKGGDDDFWMRFEIVGATVGFDFGSDGLWQEWFNPSEPSQFDLTTMPHTMTYNGTSFNVAQGNWQGRRVGDSLTNPAPDFIGQKIRDVSGFQSRLVFIAGQHVVMSRTNIEVDFFKQSATTSVSSDPIGVRSTAQTEFNMEWVVPFDRDLIIFATTSQFLITGSSALTPSNAALVQTTNFDMGVAARPASTGRTLLFPFSNGSYAGVKEFFSSAGVDASEAVSITQVQDEYMKGKVSKITASTNFAFVIVQTDHPDEARTLFVHQYYFDGVDKAQSSWSRWDFPYDIMNLFFDASQLYVLIRDPANVYMQLTLNLDIPNNPDTGYPIALDLVDNYTVSEVSGEYALTGYVAVDYAEVGATEESSSYLDLPWPDARLVQGIGCAIPGQAITGPLISDLGDGTYRYIVSASTAPPGTTVIAGLSYISLVKPTMPFIRDANGASIKGSKLVVTEFIVYYEDSGYIQATLSSKYRASDRQSSNVEIVTAFDPNDPEGRGIRSGEYIIPWGERSDWSELTISSDDVRPLTITEVEWVGQILTRGRRL
jgi:hypothetical protein